MKILLVDDRPENLLALEAVLDPLNQTLMRAGSGADALRCMLTDSFALVLLDVVMPDIDGIETARMMRERPATARTPIIFLTGQSMTEPPLSQAYRLGAVDYIVKPFDPDVLRSKVSVFVELAQREHLMRCQADALRRAQASEAEARLREALLLQEIEIVEHQRRWSETILHRVPTPLVLLSPGSDDPPFLNDAARTLAWRPVDPGDEVTELFDEHRQPLAPEQFPEAVAANGERLNGRLFFWKRAELEGAFQANSSEVPGDDRNRPGILISYFDVSHLKAIERDLQASVRAREAFISVAAHELKTPLTTLSLHVQRMARAANSTSGAGMSAEQLAQSMQFVGRGAKRLQRLVEDLLDVARMTAGQFTICRESTDLVSIVKSACEQMSVACQSASCTLTIDAPSELPGAWDGKRMEQVVVNLIGNAAKYAAGTPIHLTLASDDESAHLSVRDGGPGIAAADQTRIFDRFERSSPAKDTGGLGLGLWIVRRIVSAHGGAVAVHSEPGAGAELVVELPRWVEGRDAAPSMASSRLSSALESHATSSI